MAAASDYLEARLLNGNLRDNTAYVIPHTIRVTTLDDTATYNVYITANGDITFAAYSYSASGGDTESDILSGLQTLITGGTDPVTASTFTDLDGNAALKVEGDGTDVPFVVSVTAGGTGVMSRTQELYVALFTTNPTDADAGTEATGVGYTRELTTFAVATGTTPTSSINGSDIQFNTAGAGGWGTVSHVGILDDISAGNLLFHGSLTTSKTVSENDSFVFRTGDLTLTLD